MRREKLSNGILDVSSLTPCVKEQMFSIFSKYFVVDKRNFFRDLEEKKWIILLFEAGTENIRGFTTMKLIKARIDDKDIMALFSGDTIIEREYWNERELMRCFGNFVLKHIEKGVKFYWFLISMGFRTYRFLPLFFKRFWPRYDEEVPPFEKKVMDILASMKFGKYYDPQKGIVYPEYKCYLKEEFATIPENRLKNPHIKYFLERNRGYAKGEELVCLAEISRENLKPLSYRVIGCS